MTAPSSFSRMRVVCTLTLSHAEAMRIRSAIQERIGWVESLAATVAGRGHPKLEQSYADELAALQRVAAAIDGQDAWHLEPEPTA